MPNYNLQKARTLIITCSYVRCFVHHPQSLQYHPHALDHAACFLQCGHNGALALLCEVPNSLLQESHKILVGRGVLPAKYSSAIFSISDICDSLQIKGISTQRPTNVRSQSTYLMNLPLSLIKLHFGHAGGSTTDFVLCLLLGVFVDSSTYLRMAFHSLKGQHMPNCDKNDSTASNSFSMSNSNMVQQICTTTCSYVRCTVQGPPIGQRASMLPHAQIWP